MDKNKLFNEKFDDDLLTHDHYAKHPQMLPYIGDNFEKHRILLISESHYVPKNFDGVVGSEWYDNPNDEIIKKMDGNTSTRKVVGMHFKKKGHPLFRNIESAMNEVDDQMTIKDVAWYNFYQRPANHKTEIKNLKTLDRKVSLSVFMHNISILKPKVIIFISKNAFGSLQYDMHGNKDKSMRKWNKDLKGHQYGNIEIPIQTSTHPNSAWWNRKHGKLNETGRERFMRVLRSILLK